MIIAHVVNDFLNYNTVLWLTVNKCGNPYEKGNTSLQKCKICEHISPIILEDNESVMRFTYKERSFKNIYQAADNFNAKESFAEGFWKEGKLLRVYHDDPVTLTKAEEEEGGWPGFLSPGRGPIGHAASPNGTSSSLKKELFAKTEQDQENRQADGGEGLGLWEGGVNGSQRGSKQPWPWQSPGCDAFLPSQPGVHHGQTHPARGQGPAGAAQEAHLSGAERARGEGIKPSRKKLELPPREGYELPFCWQLYLVPSTEQTGKLLL